MAMIRWNPWSIDRLLEEDLDVPTLPILSQLAGQGLNLYETENELVAEAALPGIPEDKVNVTVDNGVVHITASSEEQKEEKDKKRYFMSSMSSSYNYSFRLPEGLLTDNEPVCELGDGVLTLRFSKAQKAPPKKLKIARKNEMKSKEK